MVAQLLVYFQQPDSLSWCLVSNGSRQPVYSGSWQELELFLQQKKLSEVRADFILNSSLCSYVSTRLNPRQLRYAEKSLSFVLEDKLAEDTRDLHLVLAEKHRDGLISAWVTRRDLMDGIRETTDQLGVRINKLVADADLIADSDCLSFVLTEQDQILVAAPGYRLSGPRDWLNLVAERKESGQQVKAWIMTEAEHATVAEQQAVSAFGQDLQVQQVQASTVGFLFDRLHSLQSEVTNLWTSDVSGHEELSGLITRFKPAAALLAVIFGLYIFSSIVDISRSQQRVDAYSLAINDLCTDIFGPEKNCRESTLKVEVGALLAGRAQNSQTPGMPTDWLTRIESVMPDSVRVLSVRINSDRQEILLSIEADQFSTLETTRVALNEQIAGSELSASQQGGAVRGNIRILTGAAQ